MNTIIKTPTKKDWIAVVEKALSERYGWSAGEIGLCEEYWKEYKENTCINLENNEIYYSPIGFYKRNYSHIPIITPEEYLDNSKKENKNINEELKEVIRQLERVKILHLVLEYLIKEEKDTLSFKELEKITEE